jgi:hypothetical protein
MNKILFDIIPNIETFQNKIENMEINSENSKQIFQFCLDNQLGYYFDSIKHKIVDFEYNGVVNDLYLLNYLIDKNYYKLKLNFKNIVQFNLEVLEYIFVNKFYDEINIFIWENSIYYFQFLSLNFNLFKTLSNYIDCKFIVFYDYQFMVYYYNILNNKITKNDINEILLLTKNKTNIKPKINMFLSYKKQFFDYDIFFLILKNYFNNKKTNFLNFIIFLEKNNLFNIFNENEMNIITFEILLKDIYAYKYLKQNLNFKDSTNHKILEIVYTNDIKLLQKYVLSKEITQIQEILFLAILKNKNKLIKFILKNYYDNIDIKKTVAFVNEEFYLEVLIDEKDIEIIYFQENNKKINKKLKDFVKKIIN